MWSGHCCFACEHTYTIREVGRSSLSLSLSLSLLSLSLSPLLPPYSLPLFLSLCVCANIRDCSAGCPERSWRVESKSPTGTKSGKLYTQGTKQTWKQANQTSLSAATWRFTMRRLGTCCSLPRPQAETSCTASG